MKHFVAALLFALFAISAYDAVPCQDGVHSAMWQRAEAVARADGVTMAQLAADDKAADGVLVAVKGDLETGSDNAKLVTTHLLPNPILTPGATQSVSLELLCAKAGYVKKNGVRNVPEAEKRAVYREYQLQGNHTGYCDGAEGCEIDHLVSLELGGSNDIKNLWPQSYTGPWNAHIKDKLENKLHALVCAGKLDLPTAQKAISSDWMEAYKRYVGQ